MHSVGNREVEVDEHSLDSDEIHDIVIKDRKEKKKQFRKRVKRARKRHSKMLLRKFGLLASEVNGEDGEVADEIANEMLAGNDGAAWIDDEDDNDMNLFGPDTYAGLNFTKDEVLDEGNFKRAPESEKKPMSIPEFER